MRIGILGSGLMGGKLGTIFARAGHDVVFSYSHSEKKLERLARDAGKNARADVSYDADARFTRRSCRDESDDRSRDMPGAGLSLQ